MLTSMPARGFATKKDDKKTETEADAEAPVKKRRGRPPKAKLTEAEQADAQV